MKKAPSFETLKVSKLAASSIILGSLIGFSSTAMANKPLDFEALGTGASLRSAIVADLSGDVAPTLLADNADHKGGEGKCGEGKCGGSKAESKPTPTPDSKAGEGKCGEGKCGGGKH